MASTAGYQGGALVQASQQQSKPSINAWVAWSLHGVGWISVLLFGMSFIPFGATAKKVLMCFAIPFWLCWWAAAILGTGSVQTTAQKHAWRANMVMAVLGTAAALMQLVAYLFSHVPSMSTVITAVAVYAAFHFYSKSQEGSTAAMGGSPAAQADAGPAEAVATPAPAAAPAPATAPALTAEQGLAGSTAAMAPLINLDDDVRH